MKSSYNQKENEQTVLTASLLSTWVYIHHLYPKMSKSKVLIFQA